MNRDEFIKKLHPAITHINASDNMSEETLEAINIMVEKVLKMTTKQINQLVAENRIPTNVKDARQYMADCEKDMGFMGSPRYYQAKKIVDEYKDSSRSKGVSLICKDCGDWYGININHKCFKCLGDNFVSASAGN